MDKSVPVHTSAGGFKYAKETSRLFLSELTIEEHLNYYHAMWSNPANLVTLPYEPMKTIEDSLQKIKTATYSPECPYIENYAIFLKPQSPRSKPEFIGVVGVIRGTSKSPPALNVDGVPEFGYMIEAAYQGKGYATEAVKGFLELYWDLERRRDVERLVAVVDKENVGSVRVIERVGGGDVGPMGEEKDGELWVIQRPKMKQV